MKYIIAIDGGGTKTKAYIGNEKGEVLGASEGGPSNYHSVGITGVRSSLNSVVQALCSAVNINKDNIDVVSLGLAGMDRAVDRRIIKALLSDIGIEGSCIFNNDAMTALIGAHGIKEGVVTICGTGSICLGIDRNGRIARTGGWGHVIGDEGSGYDIGIKCLKAVMKSHDKRGGNTLLKDKVLKYFNISSPEDLVKQIYEGSSKDSIAGLAALTAEAAFEADATAKNILEKAVLDLVEMTEAVINELYSEDDRILLSTAGGIFSNIDFVAERFSLELRKRFKLIDIYEPKFDGAVGAMIIAWNEMGISYNVNELKYQVKDVNLYGYGDFNKNQTGV